MFFEGVLGDFVPVYFLDSAGSQLHHINIAVAALFARRWFGFFRRLGQAYLLCLGFVISLARAELGSNAEPELTVFPAAFHIGFHAFGVD